MKNIIIKKIKKKTNWYIINGKNKTLGNITKTINIIKGYSINFKNLFFVIIINIEKIKFTGSKYNNKIYYSHSKFPGSLKKIKLKNLYKNKTKIFFTNFITKTLKNNKLRKLLIKRFKFINNIKHNFKSQKPKILFIN